MENFWTLLAKSVIVQSLLALIVVSAVVYLYVSGMNVPTELLSLMWLIIGFYFGTKIEQSIQAGIRGREVDRDD